MTKAIVCGGRDFVWPNDEGYALSAKLGILGVDCVITGGAKGADAYAEEIARSIPLKLMVFPANWRVHGKAAGPIRNKEMLGHADVVIAYPGGRGTANMCKIAKDSGIPVYYMEAEV